MLINNFGTNEHLNKGSFQKGSFRLRSLHIAPASLIAIPFSGIPESNFYDAIYNFSAIQKKPTNNTAKYRISSHVCKGDGSEMVTSKVQHVLI